MTENKHIFRKRKSAIPRFSKKVYKQYLLYKDLSYEELQNLITVKRQQLETLYKNPTLQQILKEILNCKSEIKLIDNIYKLKLLQDDVKKFNEFKLPNEFLFTSNLSVLVSNIITYLGYTQNSIYKEEGEYICKKLIKTCAVTGAESEDNELIASSIVMEILDHYNAKYEIKTILEYCDINEESLVKYALIMKNWCKKNYWKR